MIALWLRRIILQSRKGAPRIHSPLSLPLMGTNHAHAKYLSSFFSAVCALLDQAAGAKSLNSPCNECTKAPILFVAEHHFDDDTLAGREDKHHPLETRARAPRPRLEGTAPPSNAGNGYWYSLKYSLVCTHCECKWT